MILYFRPLLIIGSILLANVTFSSAQESAQPLPSPWPQEKFASKPFWLEPGIQREIKLTAKQRERINQIESSAVGTDPSSLGDDGSGEFDFDVLMGSVEQSSRQRQSAILKVFSPAQRNRLQQIDLQREGWLALGRVDVARKIQLTNQQQQKIQAVIGQLKQTQFQILMNPNLGLDSFDPKRLKHLNPANGFIDQSGKFSAETGPLAFNLPKNSDRGRQSLVAYREAAATSAREVDAILTADQRAAFLNLLGPSFDFGLIENPSKPSGATGETGTPSPRKSTKKS